MTTKTTGEKWLDLGVFGWLVRYEHSDTWFDFTAYEVVAENCDNGKPDDGAKLFRKRGAEQEWVTSAEDAEPTIVGFVKWDGCCELTLGRPHFCGRRDVAAFAAVLVALHDLARDTLPGFDREVGA